MKSEFFHKDQLWDSWLTSEFNVTSPASVSLFRKGISNWGCKTPPSVNFSRVTRPGMELPVSGVTASMMCLKKMVDSCTEHEQY